MVAPYTRVPNLPNGKIVDENGNPSDDELTFRHALITGLQKNFGNEGLVAPSQSAANILVIQNNQLPDPITGTIPATPPVYSCQPGTIIYNADNDTLMVSILVGGVPTFRTFTVF